MRFQPVAHNDSQRRLPVRDAPEEHAGERDLLLPAVATAYQGRPLPLRRSLAHPT